MKRRRWHRYRFGIVADDSTVAIAGETMTSPKLIDISHNIRCMGCGATDQPCVRVWGHSDVWARDWPLCASCLRAVAVSLDAGAQQEGKRPSYADLPPEPADSEWIEDRMTP